MTGPSVDLVVGRLLTALAFGFVAAGIAVGVAAWLLDNPSYAMPELTRIGFALFFASGVYGWMRGHAERKANR